ncbi:MAG: hypothetical protein HC941_07055 [Microcoleus sp. SU_5_3]|nr:hypothetical protein [Microcoleus sp. SU_5_3]
MVLLTQTKEIGFLPGFKAEIHFFRKNPVSTSRGKKTRRSGCKGKDNVEADRSSTDSFDFHPNDNWLARSRSPANN